MYVASFTWVDSLTSHLSGHVQTHQNSRFQNLSSLSVMKVMLEFISFAQKPIREWETNQLAHQLVHNRLHTRSCHTIHIQSKQNSSLLNIKLKYNKNAFRALKIKNRTQGLKTNCPVLPNISFWDVPKALNVYFAKFARAVFRCPLFNVYFQGVKTYRSLEMFR